MFAFFGSQYLPVQPFESKPVKSVEQCAEFCIEKKHCLSFDFSRASKSKHNLINL